MRPSKRVVLASAAGLLIVGGAAYAYTTAPAQSAGGDGNAAAGSIQVDWVKTAHDVVLDVPQQVTMRVTASGQVVRISRVTVVAASDWDEDCGSVNNFHGGSFLLPQAIDVYPGPGNAVKLTADNAGNVKVKLDNDPGRDQTDCTLRITATVSS